GYDCGSCGGYARGYALRLLLTTRPLRSVTVGEVSHPHSTRRAMPRQVLLAPEQYQPTLKQSSSSAQQRVTAHLCAIFARPFPATKSGGVTRRQGRPVYTSCPASQPGSTRNAERWHPG